MAEKKTFRQSVAEEMLAHIEAGTAPWQKPWQPNVAFQPPFNPVSNKAYRGVNNWWLEMQGHEDPRWLTYRQAENSGAQVRKGEKGTTVEYWQWTDREKILDADGSPVQGEDGKDRYRTVRLDRPKVFYARVFNAEQIDGLEPLQRPELKFEPIEEAEKLLAGIETPIHHDQADRAFYTALGDSIHMPVREAFPDAYEYYSTALHEAGHSTGHISRLDREFGPFGSEKYAIEELRAEMSSYMVSRELGLGHYPDRHAAYVESWMEAIKKDPNAIFRAARDAEKIRTWVMEPEKRPELRQEAERRRGAEVAVERQEPEQEADVSQSPQRKSRVYLAVPYEEKDEAKKLGARWDKRRKSWYAPEGADLEKLARWSKDNAQAKVPDVSPVEEFGAYLQSKGLVLDGEPFMDGKWHRVPVVDDSKGRKSGSYRGFVDGLPNGQVTNWKAGIEGEQWVYSGNKVSKEELARIQAEAAERSRQREAERLQRHEDVAKEAERLWNKAQEVSHPKEHAYFEDKGIKPFGERLDGSGLLLVPMYDTDGKLWNVQGIDSNGDKRYLDGGRKQGLYTTFDNAELYPEPEDIKTVVIAEGYSTAASIREHTGHVTITAFDASNLEPVARSIRERDPDVKIILAADDDHSNKINAGVGNATSAAYAVGGIVVDPKLTKREMADGLTDFNDKARSAGGETVSRIFDEAEKKFEALKAALKLDVERAKGIEPERGVAAKRSRSNDVAMSR